MQQLEVVDGQSQKTHLKFIRFGAGEAVDERGQLTGDDERSCY